MAGVKFWCVKFWYQTTSYRPPALVGLSPECWSQRCIPSLHVRSHAAGRAKSAATPALDGRGAFSCPKNHGVDLISASGQPWLSALDWRFQQPAKGCNTVGTKPLNNRLRHGVVGRAAFYRPQNLQFRQFFHINTLFIDETVQISFVKVIVNVVHLVAISSLFTRT